MADELTGSEGLPQTEAEVVARLKIRPKRTKIEATQDEGKPYVRHWVTLTYDFEDKLKKFGSFLYAIACDVEQAGGWVTQIELGTELRPHNEQPDNRRPHKKWRAMHVEVSIKTQAEVNALNAAWDEAIKDLFKQHKPPGGK